MINRKYFFLKITLVVWSFVKQVFQKKKLGLTPHKHGNAIERLTLLSFFEISELHWYCQLRNIECIDGGFFSFGFFAPDFTGFFAAISASLSIVKSVLFVGIGNDTMRGGVGIVGIDSGNSSDVIFFGNFMSSPL